MYIPSLIACLTNYVITVAFVVFHYFVHSVAIKGGVRHLSYGHALSEQMWNNITLNNITLVGKIVGKESRKHYEIHKAQLGKERVI